MRKRLSTDTKQCNVLTGYGLGDRNVSKSFVKRPACAPVFKEKETDTVTHNDFKIRRISLGENNHVIKGSQGMKIPGLVEGTHSEF